MKKALTIILVGTSLSIPCSVWAQPQAYPNEAWTLQDIVDLVGVIRNVFLILGIILIVIFMLWTGIAFLASRGNPEKVDEAKRRFFWTIIGTAVILATFAIINMVRAFLEKRWG